MDLQVVVPPTYPPGCQVVFVGEAPGKEECDQKVGFVGQAGKLLDKVIWASGLSRSEIGVTNVVQRPPDGGYDSEHFKATFYQTSRDGRRKAVGPTDELVWWREHLYSELSARKPAVIVACGAEALKALTGLDGITKHRGSILPCQFVPGCKVVPIIHPSAILRGAQWQELYISSEIIVRKVVPQLTAKHQYQRWEEHYAPTIEEWNSYVRQVEGPFALDIETRAGSIACVGLSYHSGGLDRAICVPLQTTRGPYWSTATTEWEFWRGLQWLCERYPLVGHNVFYDLDWLLDYGIQPSEVHDTMLLWHRYYPELPKSLAFCSMWFTDIPYYKDDGKTWGRNKPDVQLWEYNVKDVVATHRVWRALSELGTLNPRFQRQWQTYQEYTRPCMPLAFEMQTLGLDTSVEGVEVARGVLTAELDKVRSKLAALSGGELAIRSGNKKITDQQAVKYLYTTLKLAPKRNRKTKALTADEDALVELLIKHPQLEVLKALNAERKFTKALNSYIDISWRGRVVDHPGGGEDVGDSEAGAQP